MKTIEKIELKPIMMIGYDDIKVTYDVMIKYTDGTDTWIPEVQQEQLTQITIPLMTEECVRLWNEKYGKKDK